MSARRGPFLFSRLEVLLAIALAGLLVNSYLTSIETADEFAIQTERTASLRRLTVDLLRAKRTRGESLTPEESRLLGEEPSSTAGTNTVEDDEFVFIRKLRSNPQAISSDSKYEILQMLRDKFDRGESVTPEEQLLLRELGGQREYDRVLQDKVRNGETLTPNEQQWHDIYKRQQEVAQQALVDRLQQHLQELAKRNLTAKAEARRIQQWRQDVLDAARNKGFLTTEEQDWYDQWPAHQDAAQKAQEHLDWELNVVKKALMNQFLAPEEMHYYNDYLRQAQQHVGRWRHWDSDPIPDDPENRINNDIKSTPMAQVLSPRDSQIPTWWEWVKKRAAGP